MINVQLIIGLVWYGLIWYGLDMIRLDCPLKSTIPGGRAGGLEKLGIRLAQPSWGLQLGLGLSLAKLCLTCKLEAYKQESKTFYRGAIFLNFKKPIERSK